MSDPMYTSRRLTCPIESCDWTYDTPLVGPAVEQAEAAGQDGFDAVEGHYRQNSAIIEAHLESHAKDDWITQAAQYRRKLGEAECEIAYLLRKLGGSIVMPETAYDITTTIDRTEIPACSPAMPSGFRISVGEGQKGGLLKGKPFGRWFRIG